MSRPRLLGASSWPLLLLAFAAPHGAQELLIRSWSLREGLAHERVNAVLEERGGALWVATWEGLSRFDGLSFTNYGVAEGLPIGLVFALAEAPDGVLWVAPSGRGVARFDAQLGRFQGFPVGATPADDDVDALVFDGAGLWVGTSTGVFWAPERATPRFRPAWSAAQGDWRVQAFFWARERGWILSAEEALELDGGSVRVHAGPGGSFPRDNVNAVAAADGRVVIVTTAGLFVFDPAAAGSQPWSRVPCELDPTEIVHATAIDARGRIWLATVRGLLVLDGASVRRIDARHGLPDEWLRALTFGRDGELWIGTNLAGLVSLREPPIASFTRLGDRARLNVLWIVEALDGSLVASASDQGIYRVAQGGLALIAGSDRPPFRDVHMRVLQARDGAWWLGTSQDLWRFPGPELDLSLGATVHLGPGLGVLGLIHQDPRGRIWLGATDGGLHASHPEPIAFERVLAAAELDGHFPRTFLTDRAQVFWLATNEGLWRRREQTFERVVPAGAFSADELAPRTLCLDRRGWLWVGTRHAGAAYTRDPSAERPVFERLSTREGLASDHVAAVAEDGRGRLWLGTGGGLERFDPESGELRRFTPEEGLAGSSVNHLLRDRSGALWAAVSGGLSRIDPELEPARSAPPPVRIMEFEAAGRPWPLPSVGALHVSGSDLAPSERSLLVRFAGIDLAHGAALRFQHRLEGLDTDWSPPSAERSVQYGSLAPGAYRFVVRALTADGVASREPATLRFRLAAPLWRRGWFLALSAAASLGLAALLQRARSARRRALERVRTEIAADLHDEVGASLAQIAILSEVARRESPAAASARLGQVAELARATRSSMADLVWAIDPERDRLGDLVQRMRSVTANLLAAEGLELSFVVPEARTLERLDLGPDLRRQLLLFFQEAVHNVAKHARASRVAIELEVAGSRLHLRVHDDGRGFDSSAASPGHGLESLRRRSAALRGTLTIESRAGAGTRVELTVPL